MKTGGSGGVSSPQQVPPWLQEHIQQFQEAQQNLHMIQAQKQQLDLERIESEKALEELKAADDERPVYKHAGLILIRSTKAALLEEIEERKALAATRAQVFAKQEARIKDVLKEKEAQIQSMIQGGRAGAAAPSAAAGGAGAGGGAPPPPPPMQPAARGP